MTNKNNMKDKESQKDRSVELFMQNVNLVRLVAFEMAPVRDLTEDIVHDAFIDFVKKADQWNLDEDVVPLLRKITHNVALQHWRSYIRNLPETLGLIMERLRGTTSSMIQEANNAQLSEEMTQLHVCLDRLTPEHRALIMARYYDGKSYKEIAESGTKKEGAVQRLVSRIRAAIRHCIEYSLAQKDRTVLDVE